MVYLSTIAGSLSDSFARLTGGGNLNRISLAAPDTCRTTSVVEVVGSRRGGMDGGVLRRLA